MSIRTAIGGAALALAAITTLAATAAGTASAAPAKAATQSSTAHAQSTSRDAVTPLFNSGYCDVYGTSCKTGTIRSNGVGHYINYEFCSSTVHSADWQVKDADNGYIVRQGHLGSNACTSGRVNGLYGAYYGFIFHTLFDAFAYIDNN
jgi:hypothetical protein